MDTLEDNAQLIAQRGRDALVTRLRPAFAQAAKAHSDVLALSDEQLEQMVQQAADRADGLQWRRALASVASEELGIGLGEALGHPAVARAQVIAGAPSYEESLSAIAKPAITKPADANGRVAAPVSPAAAAEPAAVAPEPAAVAPEPAVVEPEPDDADMESEPEAEPRAADEPDPGAAPEPEDQAAHEPQAGHDPTPVRDPEPAADWLAEDEPPASGRAERIARAQRRDRTSRSPRTRRSGRDAFDDLEPLRLTAIHIGGIADLEPDEGNLELGLSNAGLDISRGGELLGRLAWREIHGLEIATQRSIRRRRRTEAHLVIRTGEGQASFQIPAVTQDELRANLSPWLERYQG